MYMYIYVHYSLPSPIKVWIPENRHITVFQFCHFPPLLNIGVIDYIFPDRQFYWAFNIANVPVCLETNVSDLLMPETASFRINLNICIENYIIHTSTDIFFFR